MRTRLLLAFLLALIGSAQAGYYATATVVVMPFGSLVQGVNSSCYLTPSMAIAGLAQMAGNSPAFVKTIDTTSATFEAYYYDVSPIRLFTGTIAQCVANPAVTTLPTFIGGATDPAIQGGSIFTGSGGGGGGGGSSTVSGTVTMTPYVPTDAEKLSAVQDGALSGGLIFTAMAGAYAFVLMRRAL